MKSIHLKQVPSRAATGVQAHQRVDPYWDGLWEWGATAAWLSAAQMRRATHAGLLKGSRARRGALSKQGEGLVGEKWHKPLGVIDSYRTVTGQQLAAFTGNTALSSPRSQHLRKLFDAGLIDEGDPAPMISGKKPRLYRPSRSTAYQNIETGLTARQRLRITGPSGWSKDSQFDRHNTLTTELLLRAAEYLPIGSIMGEKHSTLNILAHAGLGLPPIVSGRRTDGVIIRQDGLRIGLELTASISPGFTKKVEHWAKLLSERPLDTSGLIIIFVIAPPPGDHTVLAEATKVITRATNLHPGSYRYPTNKRIGVTQWEDWFPSSHHISEDFVELSANFGGQKIDILNPESMHFNPSFEATQIVENLSILHATPNWLSDASPKVEQKILNLLKVA